MGRALIKSKKVSYYGIDFDSKAEGEFYLMLRNNKEVTDIVVQPKYILLEAFTLPCNKCEGEGKVKSPKTGNDINCKSCKGTARMKRNPWTFKADFLVTYANGKQEVIDVKGFANQRFPLVKKMFESVTGQELIVWEKDKQKGWVRK